MDSGATISDAGSVRASDVTASSLQGQAWACELAVTGFGARIGVRVSDASLVSPLVAGLPQRTRPARGGAVDATISIVAATPAEVGPPAFHVLFDGEEPYRRAANIEHLLEDFDSLLRFTLAKFARDMVLIHAGVAGWNGRAIVIPGDTYSGKTSLVRALIEAGATYFSDEHAVLDFDGLVHPWLKPLSVRKPGQRRQSEITPDAFGARTATAACPVGLIVSTQYRRGARWRPRTLTPSEGALKLMAHAIAARRDPALAMRAVAAAAARACTIETARPDAARAVRHIVALLESAGAAP